ncbi:leader peptidase HopD [Salmonella enterica subsp. enterica serovar Havana]|nr:leader peptidase HopD [Salmonella enterica subsp. enterica serovar Havana]
MFVALPFLIFYASFSLLLGIYDARTGLLPDRFTCPLLWGGLLYHQICLPERLPDALWGAIAGYGGFALIYWGLSPALSERGAWIWRRQVPRCLRGVALLGNTAVTGFPCRYVGLWRVWRRATGER